MKNARVLVVEDDHITASLLKFTLAEEFDVTVASDGQAGWEILSRQWNEFDAILLDRMMPRLDGLSLLNRLRQGPVPCRTPVILATTLGDEVSVLEGLEAGAYYYLTKPVRPELLLAIVREAVAQHRDAVELSRVAEESALAQRYLRAGTFRYRMLEDVPLLAAWLAGLCPKPGRAVLGLQELMANAVEHGNLALSYEDKSRLMTEAGWFEELARRQALPEQRAKWVEVEFERDVEALCFTIRDMGAGFDWRPYLDFHPARLFDPNGRGIAMARNLCFDRLEYLGNGNTVQATIMAPR